MSKHDELSIDEMERYEPHSEILRYAGHASRREADRFRDIKILDWGCGRGRLVAYLLEHGADAFGVDIDSVAIKNSDNFFNHRGVSDKTRLHALSKSFTTDFPDDFFDVIVSDNVLEHVSDLDAVMAEMARLIRPGGRSFHLFPARFTLVEGHLFMPLIHWLPKSAMRRRAIGLFTTCGIEPKWRELQGFDPKKKAEVYFRYSRDKTFYRSPAEILGICASHGFAGRLVAAEHPRMQNLFAKCGITQQALRDLANRIVSEVKTMELYLEKIDTNAETKTGVA